MTDIPVVHLPERDYADEATRRDWRKQGYAVTAAFGGHPVLAVCPQCSAEPAEESLPCRCPHSWPSGVHWLGAAEECGLGCGVTRRHTGDGIRIEYPGDATAGPAAPELLTEAECAELASRLGDIAGTCTRLLRELGRGCSRRVALAELSQLSGSLEAAQAMLARTGPG